MALLFINNIVHPRNKVYRSSYNLYTERRKHNFFSAQSVNKLLNNLHNKTLQNQVSVMLS